MSDNREPASQGYEEQARRMFPIGEMEPERYVALKSHKFGAGGIFFVKYEDPVVDSWVARAGALLLNHKNIDNLRREWLSPEE